MSNKRRIYLLTKQATTRHATRDTRFPDWGRHCGWSKFRRQNHFLPDFVSWTGTLMGRPTTTAAANHRFPPGHWLGWSAPRWLPLCLRKSGCAVVVDRIEQSREVPFPLAAAAATTTLMMILQHYCRHLGALLTHAF